MISDLDLLEPISEYIKKELDVEVAIGRSAVCIYSKTATFLSDGSQISTYLGSVRIVKDKMIFTISTNPLSGDTISSSFDLSDPESFEKLFDKINKLMQKNMLKSVLKD